MTDNEKLMEFLVDLQHNAELSNDGVSNIKDQVISCLGDDAITITGLRMDHLGLRTLKNSIIED